MNINKLQRLKEKCIYLLNKETCYVTWDSAMGFASGVGLFRDIKEKGFGAQLYHEDGLWQVVWINKSGYGLAMIIDKEGPRAICKAVIKVIDDVETY